jgi:hypothetical protein
LNRRTASSTPIAARSTPTQLVQHIISRAPQRGLLEPDAVKVAMANKRYDDRGNDYYSR